MKTLLFILITGLNIYLVGIIEYYYLILFLFIQTIIFCILSVLEEVYEENNKII